MEFRYNGQVLGGTAGLPVFPQGMTIYSEEETVIGTYNGKPVYRRFLKGLQAPSEINTRSEYPSYGKEALHAGTVLALRGVATNSTGATEALAVLGYRASDDAFNCFILDWQDQKLIISNINRGGASSVWLSASVDVLLEYTKTTDASGSIEVLPTNYVQDYDTEDGWHVRKYSDGYVEMSRVDSITCSSASDVLINTSWSDLISTKTSVPKHVYPIPLVELYEYSTFTRGGGNGFWIGDATGASGGQENPLMETNPVIGISNLHAVSNFSFPITLNIYTRITGRWK